MGIGKFIAYFIIYSAIVLLGGFAFWKEKNEAKDAFTKGKPIEGNSLDTLLRKIQISSGFEINTIKWRRALMAAIPAVLLVFLIVFKRLPEPREFVLSFIIVFSLIYVLLKLHEKLNVQVSYNNIKEAVNLIREKINNPIKLSDIRF